METQAKTKRKEYTKPVLTVLKTATTAQPGGGSKAFDHHTEGGYSGVNPLMGPGS